MDLIGIAHTFYEKSAFFSPSIPVISAVKHSYLYFSVRGLSDKDQFTKECSAKISHFKQAILFILYMPKLIMQVLAEQDNQASTTDAKEVEKHSSLFLVQFRFLHSAFLMPEDKTCSGNNLLPNVYHAMFVSREALLEITDELNGFTFVIRHDNKHLYQYCRNFC